jgi:hypothetical protein
VIRLYWLDHTEPRFPHVNLSHWQKKIDLQYCTKKIATVNILLNKPAAAQISWLTAVNQSTCPRETMTDILSKILLQVYIPRCQRRFENRKQQPTITAAFSTPCFCPLTCRHHHYNFFDIFFQKKVTTFPSINEPFFQASIPFSPPLFLPRQGSLDRVLQHLCWIPPPSFLVFLVLGLSCSLQSLCPNKGSLQEFFTLKNKDSWGDCQKFYLPSSFYR